MRKALFTAVVLVSWSCDQSRQPVEPDVEGPAVSLSAATLTAEVHFGTDDTGSPFPPAQHDQSFHAFDKLFPRTVVIQRGGSVTYEVYPCHQPAVYAPGTQPEDVDASLTEPIGVAGCPPDRVNDPTGRLALAPAQSLVEVEWTTPPGTFDEPGTYLVICTTRVHFVLAKMYGWVIVT